MLVGPGAQEDGYLIQQNLVSILFSGKENWSIHAAYLRYFFLFKIVLLSSCVPLSLFSDDIKLSKIVR